jgi:putative tryptophan/tyrosine transport system substrate-binding protein
MQRREFIAGLGSAATLPLVARAQGRTKRVAWVGTMAEDALVFAQELAALGWVERRDIRVDYKVETDDRRLRAAAPDIVRAGPDLIVTVGTQHAEIFKQLTDTIPIVFINVADPVASGLVVSFAHPGGNVTGFSNHQFSFAGKWLAILKEFVPDLADVMVLYEPANINYRGFLTTLEENAPSLRVNVRPTPVDVTDDIALSIETFAHASDAGMIGMIVIPTALTVGHREAITTLAARHRLPAIYPFRFFATVGGLVSYGSDTDDLMRRASQYADRILKGTKPSDLPVQAPTKFEFVINLRTAGVLGLTVPSALLATADEVIE